MTQVASPLISYIQYHECRWVGSLRRLGITLQWRHNGYGSVSNHQPHDCLVLTQLSRTIPDSSQEEFISYRLLCHQNQHHILSHPTICLKSTFYPTYQFVAKARLITFLNLSQKSHPIPFPNLSQKHSMSSSLICHKNMPYPIPQFVTKAHPIPFLNCHKSTPYAILSFVKMAHPISFLNLSQKHFLSHSLICHKNTYYPIPKSVTKAPIFQ